MVTSRKSLIAFRAGLAALEVLLLAALVAAEVVWLYALYTRAARLG